MGTVINTNEWTGENKKIVYKFLQEQEQEWHANKNCCNHLFYREHLRLTVTAVIKYG